MARPGASPTWPATKTKPFASTTLRERVAAGLDAGQVRDGLGHGWLLAAVEAARVARQSARRRLDRPLATTRRGRPPRRRPSRATDAGLGIEALAPAAQQQPDDPGQVALRVPVADRRLEAARRQGQDGSFGGVAVRPPALRVAALVRAARPADVAIARQHRVGLDRQRRPSSRRGASRARPRPARGVIICQSMRATRPSSRSATLASLRSPWRPVAGSRPSAASSGDGSADEAGDQVDAPPPGRAGRTRPSRPGTARRRRGRPRDSARPTVATAGAGARAADTTASPSPGWSGGSRPRASRGGRRSPR